MLAAIIFLQENATRGLIRPPSETAVEQTVVNLVHWLRLIIETTGAVIVCFGVGLAVFEFLRLLISPKSGGYNQIRLTLARYLTLALEFQLGADILSTAVAPSWNQIGKLGAIAVIRTALNYFLMREMQAEREKSETVETAEEKGEK